MTTNQATSRPRTRDPYLDNARALLITLVVIGHVVESLSSSSAGAIQTWIYAFHMPAFVAISGHLSRSFRNEPRQLGRLLTSIVVPYILFQFIHTGIRMAMNGGEANVNFWTPGWTLWFLIALFFWRLATPLLRVLRYPLTFAVVISLIAPLEPDLDSTLSWGRALSFLPFFVLGLITPPERLTQLRNLRLRHLGLLVLGAGLALSFLIHEEFRVSIFFMRSSYTDIGLTEPQGLLTRAVVLAAGAIATLAFLAITPRGQYWWTAIGQHSLTVYLLHAVVLRPLRDGDVLERIDDPLGTVLAILGAIVLTYLLSRPWVVRGTRWLTNPPIEHWLVRMPSAPSGAGARSGDAAAPAGDSLLTRRTHPQDLTR